ncbi:MAG TPA: CBS domain-containing protein [Thermomicrobiales bacterium]|jgi:CBS domain-containing protein
MPEATVRELMRTEVPTVSPSDSVALVARLMADSGLPGVPVVSEGSVVGIVTESDLIERQAEVDVPSSLPFFDAVFTLDGGRDFDDDLRHVLAVTAGDLMTHPVFNVLDTATLTQVATLMIDKHVNPIPVLDHQTRQLIGIVSRADLVRVIARLEAAASADTASDPVAPPAGER